MLRPIFSNLGGVLAISMAVSGCAESPDPDDALDPGGTVQPTIALATFHLDTGSTVEFIQTAGGEIAVGETSAAKNGHARLAFGGDSSLDPLERYLRIAPSTAPIPRALAALDAGRGLVGNRASVDTLEAPISVAMPAQFSPWDVDVNNACATAEVFYNDVCKASSATINEFWFCDWRYGNSGNVMWADLIEGSKWPRWGSAAGMHRSVTWTLSCYTPVRVQHQAWLDGQWATILDKTQDEQVISSWTQAGSDRWRAVHVSRTTNSSGFRNFAYFDDH